MYPFQENPHACRHIDSRVVVLVVLGEGEGGEFQLLPLEPSYHITVACICMLAYVAITKLQL